MDGPQLFRMLAEIPEDKFVLHGSPQRLSHITPQQAYLGEHTPDMNECAVYATSLCEIALLYALIHEPKEHWGWRLLFHKGVIDVYTKTFSTLKGGVGFLHVLPRACFTRTVGSGLIHLSYEPVVPHRIIAVEPQVLEYMQQDARVQFFAAA